MRLTIRSTLRWACGGAISLAVTGCVLAPKEAEFERKQMNSAGAPYAKAFEKRTLPDLPDAPTEEQVVRRGLVADGELEAAYFDWAAAVARINQAGAYPNSPVSVGLSQELDRGRIRSFDQTSITVAPDAMENLAFPSKTAKAGAIATDMARAAGKRFVARRLATRQKLLDAWLDYVLLAERIRIQQQNVDLLGAVQQTTRSRLQSGAMETDLLRADAESRLAANQLASMQAERDQQRAQLNAMLARPAEAPLIAPNVLPAARPMAADDATLIVAAAERNPELLALSHEVAGKDNAIDLARMAYIPDFNPSFGITGSSVQMVGLNITLPTVYPRIEGAIAEAKADRHAAEAMLRQKRQDTAASLVAALVMMRNAERQADVFSRDIVPIAQRVVDSTRRNYAAGGASYLDLIAAQRLLLDARLMRAEARITRDKSLAQIETLAGFDVDTLAPRSSTTQPVSTTQEVHHD